MDLKSPFNTLSLKLLVTSRVNPPYLNCIHKVEKYAFSRGIFPLLNKQCKNGGLTIDVKGGVSLFDPFLWGGCVPQHNYMKNIGKTTTLSSSASFRQFWLHLFRMITYHKLWAILRRYPTKKEVYLPLHEVYNYSTLSTQKYGCECSLKNNKSKTSCNIAC